MPTQILLLWWKDKFCKMEVKEQGISHKLRIPRFQSFNFHGFSLSIKGTRSDQDQDNDWLSVLPSSIVSLCMNLIYVRCLVLYFKFYRIYLSTKPTKFDGIFISHNSTKHLYTFPAKLFSFVSVLVNMKQWETTTNVTTNLAVTLRLSWP